MVRAADGGAAIEVEVYSLTAEAFGRLAAKVPSPLCIGAIELERGELVRGFLCEPYALDASTDITAHGGWRAYLSAD
jgi:allophanate hydrolase